jgi:phosphomannomutase
VWDRLDELAARHGVHLTAPVTVRLPGLAGMARRAEVLARLAADPPRHLGEVAVVEVEDLSVGAHLPPTEGVVLHLADRARVIVRPSGTEPKLKGYVEVIEPVTGGDVATARQVAEVRLARCTAAVQAELER